MRKICAALILGFGTFWVHQAVAVPCEAYFPFDGNIDDTSGHGNHGLMITKEMDLEGEPPAAQFAEGKIGRALHITAGNAMRAFIDLHYDFCPKITITAWFRLASANQSGPQYIFSTGAGNGPAVYANGGNVSMRATGNGITQRDAIRDPNHWWFVAAVYDYEAGEEGTYELHWRNRVVPGVMANRNNPPEDSFWIGAYEDRVSYNATDLYIDDLRIHPAALSKSEIDALAADLSGSWTSISASAPSPAQTSTNTRTNTGIGFARNFKPEFDPILKPGLPTGTTTLPVCESHQDCDAGSYCAWDRTCHPDQHSPMQAIALQTIQTDLASNILLPEVESESAPATESDSALPPGPYGQGNPSFTNVAGSVGGTATAVDLGEEFLQRVRLYRTGPYADACRIFVNDRELDMCKRAPEAPETITVELSQSVIGRVSVCAWGTVLGMQVWGDVIDPDGSTRYVPASDKAQFSSCAQLVASDPNVWSSSMMCGAGKLATGLVVHSHDRGTHTAISGLQLICRSIGVR
jgi:hypothetical protein